MTPASRLANSEGYGRRLQRTPGWLARPPVGPRMQVAVAPQQKAGSPSAAWGIATWRQARPNPTKASPWRARAKTDGQWGRDGEIR
jgi:hypothetical protein